MKIDLHTVKKLTRRQYIKRNKKLIVSQAAVVLTTLSVEIAAGLQVGAILYVVIIVPTLALLFRQGYKNDDRRYRVEQITQLMKEHRDISGGSA